ncbi:MAG TPA: hypothetical protein VE954_21375 [Oligoflexus sp.]|uniref:hypothetical protein n=1 Tax=Oligoflexus sp. TaxID=1971216 RepID=UPI002D5DEBE4|nr:hypothetical protein [Oligoflexus sp.]HYX35657.1 hypothetical protein [Oligoflexus sp.]
MTLLKSFIALGLGISLVSCHKDDDHGPQGTTGVKVGFTLKTDSPYADHLPYFASCGSADATNESSCPVQ